MENVVTKEQAIEHAIHLDLNYSHSGTLYDIICHYTLTSNNFSQSTPRPNANGVVEYVSTPSVVQFDG